MAKKLDTSACSATTGFPPKQGTWDFLQLAHQEATSSIIQSMIGPSYSVAVPYVLYGFAVTGGGIYPVTYSPGALFFNGEIFLFPGQTIPGTYGFPDVGVLDINTAYYTINADPVLFTDAVSRYVHNIRTVYITGGPSGSGDISDVHALVYLSAAFNGSTGTLNGLTVAFNANNTYVRMGTALATNTITLDFTNANIGAIATIVGFISHSDVISISTTGSNFVKSSSLIGPTSCSYCIITITYLGNISGTNMTATVVSYDV